MNEVVGLDEKQIETYWTRGYIVIENALNPEEVEAAKQGLSHIVQSYTSNPEQFDVEEKTDSDGSQSGVVFRQKDGPLLFQLERKISYQNATAEELEAHVRKYMWFENATPIFKHIYTEHPKIVTAVTSLLGDDVELYQSMALVKPAHIGIDKPWHQDNAYFAVEDLDGVLGTWIALDEATIENGCMHFLPGGHHHGPLRRNRKICKPRPRLACFAAHM